MDNSIQHKEETSNVNIKGTNNPIVTAKSQVSFAVQTIKKIKYKIKNKY